MSEPFVDPQRALAGRGAVGSLILGYHANCASRAVKLDWQFLMQGHASILMTASGEAAYIPDRAANGRFLERALVESDFLNANLALDELVRASSEPENVRLRVEALVSAAREIAGNNPSDGHKLDAVRQVLHTPGPWNDGRPFAYDHDNRLGERASSKLLSTYVESRLGNCVTMPILFLIVAQRLGLNMSLSTAPLHLLVRYTRPGVHPFNIEATSGGGFARDEWYRQQWSISDRAIESGLYLRTHTVRETVALMATTVLDHLLECQRNEDAAAVAHEILEANPLDGYTMVKAGTAFGAMLKAEFLDRYASPSEIPGGERQRYLDLAAANRRAFADAEALGWEPVDETE